MTHRSRSRERVFAGFGLGLLVTGPAAADDLPTSLPVKAPVAYVAKAARLQEAKGYDWSGWYVGAHIGVIRGSSNWSATQPGFGGPALNGSFDLPFNFDFMAGTGSYVAGLQGGYNHVFPSHWLLGFEADASFPNSDVLIPYAVRGSQTVTSPLAGEVTYGEAVIHYGSARARIGYAFDHLLLYGTGGLAWTYDQVTRTQVAGVPVAGFATPGTVDTALMWRLGWAAGIGVEVPVAGNWSARAEFLWTGFGRLGTIFPAGAQNYSSDLNMQSLRLGLNYKIGDDTHIPDFLTKGASALETDRVAFHAQATYLNQYDPPFAAPYSGKNSLAPNIGRETADITLYAGVRLWQGAEAWITPEIDQGFGLSGSVGAAGFPSGEAYKVGAEYPYTRLQRAFLRQTIDLGGEAQKVDAGLTQFSGTQTADRLVFTIGKFSVGDIFDTNKYAHDPRVDFMNWTIIDTGTFDYAADAWAYTVGSAVEWYQGPWTVRAGIFDLSTAPNTTTLDSHFDQFQLVGEIERRYSIADQPGKLAITGFLTRGRMGSFEDAIQLAAITGGPADIAAVRQYQSRGGISMNLEQQLMPNVGFFARAGIANGNIEPYEFTDVDRTVAAGLSISGKQWGRDDDTFGIAGVVNGISRVHQAFLNDGGLGILVGDGMLPNPGNEKILETYYSFPVFAAKVTLDYQLIVNPAYNRDRGPVSVLGFRLHTQY
ncbi:MAG: porin [Bradyrhizobium sp.]|uniref:carbohydrate porin n=1 Tax=Bradyrhizobium sp. TaxID=376 RepID=UPI0011FA785B|nr:carbohydrate porin [Bradyrhizobium sp.]THD60019.1 MAG: porin [Bradyrhizobium sp.]